MPTDKGKISGRICQAVAVAAALLFYLGFFFHTCKGGHIFGRYSFRYIVFLSALLVAGLALFIALRKLFSYLLRRRLRGFASVLAVTFVAFFSVEGLYHVALMPLAEKMKSRQISATWRMAHPFLTYANRRDKNPWLGINSYGFLGKEMAAPKPKHELRIFALGGSTTECDRQPGWTAELERLLSKAARGKTVRVYNLGVAGWCTAHSIINYLLYARDFEPDIIIFYHGWNDFYRSFYNRSNRVRPEFYNDYAHYIEGKAYWKEFFPYHHRPDLAMGVIKQFLGRFWYSDFLISRPTPADDFDLPSLKIFERNLQLAADLFKQDRRRVIFITQPSLYKPEMMLAEEGVCWTNKVFFVSQDGRHYASNKFLFAGIGKFNEAIREAALKNDNILVDFARELPATLEFFVDDVHLTPKGNMLLAGSLKEAVVKIW